MGKILLAIGAVIPNKKAFDFACFLARLTKSSITGIFFENLLANEKAVLETSHGLATMEWEVDETSPAYKAKMKNIEKNISSFKESCLKEGIRYNVHRDRGVPAIELIDESRFADLIVIDAETSFNKIYEGSPTEFVKDILKKTECPVIIAPEIFESIDEIVFTYDGRASSVFAIKQFTYLFPQLHNKKTVIIQANEKGIWDDPDKYNFSEWLQEHYTNLHFEALKGETEKTLFDYLLKRKNIFIVMGAYGRNAVSSLFSHSRADLLIKTLTQPIFIAHK